MDQEKVILNLVDQEKVELNVECLWLHSPSIVTMAAVHKSRRIHAFLHCQYTPSDCQTDSRQAQGSGTHIGPTQAENEGRAAIPMSVSISRLVSCSQSPSGYPTRQ